MKRNLFTRIVAAFVACIATTAVAWADEVTDWNETLFRTALVAATSPLNMSRVSALVQAVDRKSVV